MKPKLLLGIIAAVALVLSVSGWAYGALTRKLLLHDNANLRMEIADLKSNLEQTHSGCTKLVQDLSEQLDGAQKTISEKEAAVSERDTKIAELESRLLKSNASLEEEHRYVNSVFDPGGMCFMDLPAE